MFSSPLIVEGTAWNVFGLLCPGPTPIDPKLKFCFSDENLA